MTGRLAAPPEVWWSTAVLGGGAVLFLGLALLRVATEGGADLLRLPAAVALIALAVGVGLVLRLRFARGVAIVVLVVVAVLHLLVALGAGPWWARLVSAVLAAAHVYALVLLNTEPARRYLEAA